MGEPSKSMRTSIICALLVLSVVGVLGDDRHDHDDSERDHRRDHRDHRDHDHQSEGGHDLGDSSGAEAQMRQEARVETQGMYNSDIRASRAYNSLDDAMDHLQNSLSSLTTKSKKLKDTTVLLQENAGRGNLGESAEEAQLDASTEGMYDADVEATRVFTALDNEMDKLSADMSVTGSGSTSGIKALKESIPAAAPVVAPTPVAKSKDMGESDDDHDQDDDDKDDDKDRDDDDDEDNDEGQEALIQVASTKGAGDSIANKLVIDDLAASGSSLMARAKMEAAQTLDMDKTEVADEQETRQDLGQAQDTVNAFTSDDNALEVTELDEADAASKAQKVKETGLAEQLQQAETKQAKEYMAQAANKESSIIARAEAKEKKMENEAHQALANDVK